MRRDNIIKLPQIVYISSGEGINMANLTDSEKLIFDQVKQINDRLTIMQSSMVHREEVVILAQKDDVITLKADFHQKLKELENDNKHNAEMIAVIDKAQSINGLKITMFTTIGVVFGAAIINYIVPILGSAIGAK